MNKLLAAIVLSTFAFGSASGFAADTAFKKKEELTREERMDMRDRAERLAAERAAHGSMQRASVTKTPKAHKHYTHRTKKGTKPAVKKAEPKA